MSDDATNRLMESVRHAIRLLSGTNKAKPAVDIVTDGLRRLVYINGQRINGVLDIELPVKADEIGPQLTLRLLADQIVQRTVSADEFRQMLQGDETDATHPAHWCTGTCRGGLMSGGQAIKTQAV